MRKKNRPVLFYKEPLVPVYLGDVVLCDAYLVKTKKYFSPNYKKGILELREQDNKVIKEIESGCIGELSRYDLKKPSRPFRGVCVGVANKNTTIHEVLDDDVLNKWTVDNKQFTVVYYADNKKRLVPFENIIQVYTSHTIKPWSKIGE